MDSAQGCCGLPVQIFALVIANEYFFSGVEQLINAKAIAMATK